MRFEATSRRTDLLAALLALWFAAGPGLAVTPAPELPHPVKLRMTRDQQKQLGLQLAGQVCQQMPVLPDSGPETKYIQALGARLVATIPVVAQKAITRRCPGPPRGIALHSLDWICRAGYITSVAYSVEVTDEFQAWFAALTSAERISVAAKITLLEEKGPSLSRPHADTLKGSKITNLKELIIQHAGDPYRVLFVFDPRRTAVLLLGGRKADSKWYKTAIPAAEKSYAEYLEEIKKEGLI